MVKVGWSIFAFVVNKMGCDSSRPHTQVRYHENSYETKSGPIKEIAVLGSRWFVRSLPSLEEEFVVCAVRVALASWGRMGPCGS